jgi:hypothetical protein
VVTFGAGSSPSAQRSPDGCGRDACRDNPFRKPGTRSLGLTRGLELREPAQGVFAIYSAGFN